MALAAGEGDRPSLLITPAPIPGVGVSSGTISVSDLGGDLGGLGGLGGEATGVAFISAAPAAASPVILRELDLSFSEWISDDGSASAVSPLLLSDKITCTVCFVNWFALAAGHRAGLLVHQWNSQRAVYKTYCTRYFVT